jgi:hypothetical protein|tara:strand:- start:542 stop:823 length:282 start_codon:yes stop_codon:yes gene_type:complete
MYVSFTDWEFDGDVDKAVEGIKANWAEMKKYGAVNGRCTVTGENTLRTMTLWSSQELMEANVDTIRALATSASGMKPTGAMKGPLALQLTEND